MIIYADELFIKNFVMSYLILVISFLILSKKYKKRNLIISSLISSIITLFAVIYEIDNSIITRIVTITLMVKISFNPKDIKDFIIELATILVITFLIGGVIKSSIKNSYEIIICGALCVIALKKYSDYYKQKKWKIRNKYKIEFELENKKIILDAFLDTGNFLKTNVKGEPVVVISKDKIFQSLSKSFQKYLITGKIEDTKIIKNIRFINYTVLNEQTKMIYGLKINDMKIKTENYELKRDAVIVLSQKSIKECDAIFGLSLLEGGLENGDSAYAKTESEEFVC